MSTPLDEIDVGHDARTRPPWQHWSRRTRRAVAALVALVVVAAGGLWLAGRDSAPTPAAAVPVVTGAPGADVVVDLGPATDRCPADTRCRFDTRVGPGDEAAFRAAFGSAGFIGRQTVVDDATGEVLLQLIRFSTGTLVTVTLTQEPVARLATPPVVDDTPTAAERGSGSVTLTAVRDGYLMTAAAAGLPGQTLPVDPARQWVRTAPAP